MLILSEYFDAGKNYGTDLTNLNDLDYDFAGYEDYRFQESQFLESFGSGLLLAQNKH